MATPPAQPVVNQEELAQLRSERDNVNEKLAAAEGKISLLEQEKLRIQQVSDKARMSILSQGCL